MLLVGHLGSSILLVLFAVSIVYDLDLLKLVTICAYSFLFNVTNATVVNVYLVEICTDIAFGAALVTMQLVILVETATALEMIARLTPQGFFMFYALTSFIGFLFVYFWVGETKHLSEKEKKQLYQPGGKFGRKISGGMQWEGRSTISSEMSDYRLSEPASASPEREHSSIEHELEITE